ncbi:MAG: DUF1254 domain-containing protein [Pseudochelatococcus sp.]|jgi:hypothetical protein|uniref:DUF1254 domain-containing protein n=1 Tax=Pseudochelatococcus sp. TaxID=2020869 RepID=UPI003D8C4544
MNRRTLIKIGAGSMLACRPAWGGSQSRQTELIREALVYTYPLVKNYLTMFQYAFEEGGRQYKGPPNTVNSVARVYTPQDTAIITPNSDTPYSFIVFDLRAEPVIISLPNIEAHRYYSLQLVDLYTHNVDYLGSRRDGNGGGDFLIAGPGWRGTVPTGVRRVVTMPTTLAMGLVRTQLLDPSDLARVREIQAGYVAQPLSSYLGQPAPLAPTAVQWPVISDEILATDFWSLATFLLEFAAPLPGEEEMRSGYTGLGIAAGGHWPDRSMSPELVAEMRAAVRPGLQSILAEAQNLTDSSTIFGDPDFMKGRYLTRAAAAMGGIYGNSVEEALYINYNRDDQGASPDGSKHRYVLRFASEADLPPVGAFWSLTMYATASQLLVENPLSRYVINSAMLPGIKPNDRGEILLYLQHESPGPELESNWLPAPAEPFYAIMRLYLPKPEALDKRWTAPSMERLA